MLSASDDAACNVQASRRVTARFRVNSSRRASTLREAVCFSSGSTATASSPALDCSSTKVSIAAEYCTAALIIIIIIFPQVV